ncbi:WD40/YVTN/BNR-like repeat-containing protein [candidate division KSB1 bacterium]
MNAKHSFQLFVCILLFCCLFFQTADSPAQVLSGDLLDNLTYREIGPTRQSGRFVDIAVPMQDPYIIYMATASGGLWKSTNNGITFEPIFDHEEVFSIGDVTVDPSNPDIVWVGTGEANNSRSCYWGNGVYKSTDAGMTWRNIGRIVIDPDNSDVVYVAALGHLYSENPERGLYKTTNGGRTWAKVLDVVVRGKNIGVVDVVMDPLNSSVLYAATFDKVRKPWTYNLGGPGSAIYKTTDAGRNWEKLGGGLPGGMLGRIGLAVYLRNPQILYATIENANKEGMSDAEREQELLDGKSSRGMIGGEIYRTENGGRTWVKTNPDDQPIGGGPAYYYGQIIIDPNDDQVVHVLSASSWGSTDGGRTWASRPLGFGGDDHGLWIDPRDSRHILLGYDHGMGITYDGGENWYHPDNLPLAQFYAIGVDMAYPYNVYGGLQDNGSHKGPSTRRDGGPIRLEDWDRVGGGDGMYNVVDPSNNRYLYNESQFGPIQRRDMLTGETKSIRYQGNPDLRFNWNAPIHISPHNSDVIYHGANILLKSPFRGEYWEEISPDLTDPDPLKLTTGRGGDGNIQYSTITTISESPVSEGIIWVGTDDGNVQLTTDGGETWTKLNSRITGNPEYWVSRVTASNHFPGTAYVSYTGYRRDDFRPFVYKTTDLGQTWRSIAGNLPNEPVNVIKEDLKNPDLLFIGTEFAVHLSIDGGRTWTKMKNNMPTQPVQDLVIHPRENDLIAGTHGRGIFITDISPLQELTPQVLAEDVHLFDIESKVNWVSNTSYASSSSNYWGQSEPRGVVINYYLRNTVIGDVRLVIYQGARMINEIEGENSAGINRIIWNMDQRLRERTDEEIERMRGQRGRFGGRGGGDPRYVTGPAPEGEYLVRLIAGGREITKKAVILKDHWYDK